MMNQSMRHAAARVVSASVNAHPDATAEFVALINSGNFKEDVELHCGNPDTAAAKCLVQINVSLLF